MDNTLSHNVITDGAIFVGTGSVTNGDRQAHHRADNTVLSICSSTFM
jgi:hypothetical protein